MVKLCTVTNRAAGLPQNWIKVRVMHNQGIFTNLSTCAEDLLKRVHLGLDPAHFPAAEVLAAALTYPASPTCKVARSSEICIEHTPFWAMGEAALSACD